MYKKLFFIGFLIFEKVKKNLKILLAKSNGKVRLQFKFGLIEQDLLIVFSV